MTQESGKGTESKKGRQDHHLRLIRPKVYSVDLLGHDVLQIYRLGGPDE